MKKVKSPSLDTKGCQKNSPKSSGSSDHNSRKQLGKIQRLFGLFICGKSLNRFEAQKYGCSCLNTTINDIRRNYGVRLNRRSEFVSNRWSKTPTKVTRYWLAVDDRPYAMELLVNELVTQGKAKDISAAIQCIQSLLDE